MSYDLHVYTADQPDEAALAAAIAAGGLAVADDESDATSLHIVRGAKATYCCTLGLPEAMGAEDVPEELGAAGRGLAWVTEILVEGSSPVAVPHAVRLARRLARSHGGVVHDPQTDEIWGKGASRTAEPVPSGLVDVVELRWYVRSEDSSMAAEAWLELAQRHLPEAMPRRFGDFEPLKGSLERDGREAFGDALAGALIALFFTCESRYFTGHLGLGASDPGLASHELTVHRSLLEDPAVAAAVRRFFVEFADRSRSMYASANVSRDWQWTGRKLWGGPEHEPACFPARRGQWLGLPPEAPWLSWFGPDYRPLVEPHLDPRAAKAHGDGLFFAVNDVPLDADQIAALQEPPGRWLRRLGRVTSLLRAAPRRSAVVPWLPAELTFRAAPVRRGRSRDVERHAAIIPEALRGLGDS